MTHMSPKTLLLLDIRHIEGHLVTLTGALQLRCAQNASLTIAHGPCCASRKLHKRLGSFALCWSKCSSLFARRLLGHSMLA